MSTDGRWPPYPAYKDSGVEWLGEIPEHWETWKLSHAFRQIGSGTTPPTSQVEYYDGEIPWVNTSELRDGPISDTLKKLTPLAVKDFPTLRLFPPGTLLVAMYGATIGKVGLLEIAATTNQACCALAASTIIESKFAFYWLVACRLQLVLLASGGGQPNISQAVIRSLRIAAPPLHEQRAIAAFLDRETARIDALIARKQRLIELLQEKRSALISRAVTQGLDPNVEMRGSGVEWLGEIPEHWDMRPLASVARLQRGHDLTVRDRLPGDIPVISSSGISGFHNMAKVKGPGVVTGRYGTIGTIYYVDQDFWPMNTTLYVRDFHNNLERFIYYLLMILPFDAHSNKSAVPGVDRNDLHVLQVTCPPYPEQEAIAAFLDEATLGTDRIVSRIEEAIEKLREYRTVLISAAVTGKIDVRPSPRPSPLEGEGVRFLSPQGRG